MQDHGYELNEARDDYGRFVAVPSAALGRAMPCLVFEPSRPGPHPLGIALHGVNDQSCDESGLRALYGPRSGMQELADAVGVVLVCPQLGRTWYVDLPELTGHRYASFVGEDLVAWCEAELPVLHRREARFLIGFSMGGHGAVHLLCRYPDTFAVAASRGGVMDLAFGVHDLHWDDAEPASQLFGSYWDDPRRFHQHSCLTCINHIAERRDLAVVLDVGTDDFTYLCNRRMRSQLQRLGIKHLWSETPDGHVMTRADYTRLLAAVVPLLG